LDIQNPQYKRYNDSGRHHTTNPNEIMSTGIAFALSAFIFAISLWLLMDETPLAMLRILLVAGIILSIRIVLNIQRVKAYFRDF